MGLYKQSDMTRVVDAAGEVQPDEVPKAWVGTDLLPEGTKATSKKAEPSNDDA